MKNPPKRPRVPKGYRALWIPPVHKWKYYGKAAKGRPRRRVEVLARKGHYRLLRVAGRAPVPPPRRVELWEPVLEFQRRLRDDRDLAAMDPIYRYKPTTDQIRAHPPTMDPISGLVWGTPFKANDVYGKFIAGRVWFIVKDTNLDRAYLYVRTALFPTDSQGTPLVVPSAQAAIKYLDALREAIRREYAGKAYMKDPEFVAWTVFARAGEAAPTVHKKFRGLSKEKSYHLDERRGRLFRNVSPWERLQIAKEEKKRPGGEPFLKRSFNSYGAFQKAYNALPQERRRYVLRVLGALLEDYDKSLERRRKGRK